MRPCFFVGLALLPFTLNQANAEICGVPKISRDCIVDAHRVALDAHEVEIEIEHVYAPKGFDSNDKAEVLAVGWLPSPCHEEPRVQVNIADNNIYVSMKSKISKRGRVCVSMAVPFLVPVPLGELEEGTFTVHYGKNTQSPRQVSLGIDAADSSREDSDSHIYAHVEHVAVDVAGKQVTISGKNPSDCVEFDHFEIISNNQDTYAVLPIMRQIKADCPRKLVGFEYHTEIPNQLNKPKILLHVRSLEGKSVNYLLQR